MDHHFTNMIGSRTRVIGDNNPAESNDTWHLDSRTAAPRATVGHVRATQVHVHIQRDMAMTLFVYTNYPIFLVLFLEPIFAQTGAITR